VGEEEELTLFRKWHLACRKPVPNLDHRGTPLDVFPVRNHPLQGEVPQLIMRRRKRIKVLEGQVSRREILADELLICVNACSRENSRVIADLVCNPVEFKPGALSVLRAFRFEMLRTFSAPPFGNG